MRGSLGFNTPRSLLLTSLFLFAFRSGSGSFGDQQKEYKKCLIHCGEAEQCDKHYFPVRQSVVNKIFGWTCPAECQYQCMWTVEKKNRAAGIRVFQYYGKWPFTRILGIQEPASVLFSLGNMAAHIYGYHHIYLSGLEDNKAADWFLHGLTRANYYVSLNAWLWSAVFHSRDVYWTMLLDYSSAIALIFTSLATSICRAFNVRERRRQQAVIFAIGLYYCRHVYYMTMVNFNFSWNMKIAVGAAGIYLVLFAAWSLAHIYHGKRRHSQYALAACLCTLAACSLEVSDFFPLLSLVDAHALWHASTIPIIFLWYRFYASDIRYDLGIIPLPLHKRLNNLK